MRWFIYLFLMVSMTPLSAGAVTVTDDAGQSIPVTTPAKRLLVLAPDLVENVFAIGAGDRVVGVVQGCDYPPAARRLQQVGSYAGVDLERILALHPDLIVTWKYAFPRQLAALKRFGIPVYVAAPKKLEDIPHLMRNLGHLTGQDLTAEMAAQHFEKDINELKSEPRLAPAPKVFFQIDRYALITVNQDSWINQVIELCGGKNIFAHAKVIAPQVNRESIVMENPDIIFNVSVNDDWKQSWQSWSSVTAVKQQRLVTLQPDWISRAGPRLVQGAGQVCAALRVRH